MLHVVGLKLIFLNRKYNQTRFF